MPDKESLPHRRDRDHSIQSSKHTAISFRLAIALAVISIMAFEAALFDEYRVLWSSAAAIGTELVVIFGLGSIFRRMDARRPQVAASLRRDATMITILCLAAIPFAIELAVRSSSSESMLPLELLLLVAFRNIVLATAVFAHRRDCQQACCTLSLFLVIFATSLSSNRVMLMFLVLFAMIGMGWLFSSHQESAKSPFLATDERGRKGRSRIGWLLALTPILLAIPITVTQPQTLSGFIPSSGGTASYNQLSRSGVGDGDDLIAGTDNIQSFAPIEDAPFMSSHEPSLYDLFDDTYNEPVKIEKQERSIALSDIPQSTPSEAHPVDTQKAGKEFSTLRKAHNSRKENIAPHASDALFYVKGRLPIHLKMEVFDRFDGINWYAEEVSDSSEALAMEVIHGQPWLRLPLSPAFEFYAKPDTHALKIVHLDTNRIPSPTQLLGIHIDKLDRSDFYQWAQPGLIRMDREKLPSGIVMNVQSRVADERLVEQKRAHLASGPSCYRDNGTLDRDNRIRILALKWTEGIDAGWPQVRAVVRHLRTEYQHDRDARPTADCDNTVADFLFNRRCGPDYEFASAATVLLRSLGISIRLASGFYVDDARFDPRARHSAATKDHVHVWAEVNAGRDHWLPIEPTPGYELLKPPPTFLENVVTAVFTLKTWVANNFLSLLVILFVALTIYQMRHDLADARRTLIWRLRTCANERELALRTLRLLTQRCQQVHRRFPNSLTPTRWLKQVTHSTDETEQVTLSQFTRLAEWAAYAGDHSASPVDEVTQLCHRAVSTWSLTRLRRGSTQTHARSAATPWGRNFIRIWQCGETW